VTTGLTFTASGTIQDFDAGNNLLSRRLLHALGNAADGCAAGN
jgi:hypothetical protein